MSWDVVAKASGSDGESVTFTHLAVADLADCSTGAVFEVAVDVFRKQFEGDPIGVTSVIVPHGADPEAA